MAEVTSAESGNNYSQEDFVSLSRRARHAAIRAWGQGAGLFLFAMICTAVLFVSLRVGIPQLRLWATRLSGAVESVFQEQLDTTPTRDISPVVAILTAALTKTEGKYSLLECSEPDQPCPVLSIGSKSVASIYGFADTLARETREVCLKAEERGACIHNLVTRVQPLLASEVGGFEAEAVAISLQAVIEERTDPTAMGAGDMLTQDCKSSGIVEEAKGRALLLPSANCNRVSNVMGVRTLVPQEIIDVPAGVRSQRIARALVESRLFEFVAKRVEMASDSSNTSIRNDEGVPGQEAPAIVKAASFADAAMARPSAPANPDVAKTSDLPSLVQAYFISVDSILSIWDPRGDPDPLPPNRLWTQGIYFYELLNSNDRVKKSGLYIDTGGNGLVRTYCFPVESDRLNGESQPSQGSSSGNVRVSNSENSNFTPDVSREFEGAICFDLGLPSSWKVYSSLVEVLQSNPLVEVAAVQLTIDDERHVSDIGEIDPHLPLDETVLGFNRDELLQTLRQDTKPEDVSRYVTSHKLRNKVFAIIPLARSDARTVRAIIMLPRGLAPPAPLWIPTVTGCFSLLGMLIALFRLGGSKRESRLDAQLARLRSLPVGVIETDSSHRVISANDRAEELVDCELPKIAVTDSEPAIGFDNLFEDEVYVVETPNAAPSRMSAEHDVRRRRLAGQRSVYFAKTKAAAEIKRSYEWVKIIASPLLPVPGQTRVRVTESSMEVSWAPAFGVVLECTQSELSELQRLDQLHKSTHKHQENSDQNDSPEPGRADSRGGTSTW